MHLIPDSGAPLPHPVTTPKKPPVTVAVAERAAKAAGFDVINARQLEAAGEFGRFVSEVGAIHLGRARLAVNLERAEAAMKFCEDAAREAVEMDHALGMMKVHADLLGKSNSAAEALMKSAQIAADAAKAEAGIQVPGFAPRQPVSPPAVNVVVTSKDARVDVSGPEIDVGDQ
jgi:hypothetical protein